MSVFGRKGDPDGVAGCPLRQGRAAGFLHFAVHQLHQRDVVFGNGKRGPCAAVSGTDFHAGDVTVESAVIGGIVAEVDGELVPVVRVAACAECQRRRYIQCPENLPCHIPQSYHFSRFGRSCTGLFPGDFLILPMRNISWSVRTGLSGRSAENCAAPFLRAFRLPEERPPRGQSGLLCLPAHTVFRPVSRTDNRQVRNPAVK